MSKVHNYHHIEETVSAETEGTPVERREHVRVVQDQAGEYREQVVEHVGETRRAQIGKLDQFIWLIFGAIEILIGLRIVLRLIGANPQAPFAQFVYGFSDIFLWPFYGLTATPGVDNMVLEISSIIAMIVYAVIAWGLTKLLYLLFTPSTARSVTVVDQERRY